MKRKIAAVLMADIASPEARAVIASAVARGGGRVLAEREAVSIAEFQSAVEAVRAAIDAQATLRARNKALPPDAQIAFRLAIAIGEVIDGAGDVPEETLEAAGRLVGLADAEGVCLSRSVRDAVVSKLRLHMLDVTVEGERPKAEPAPRPGTRTSSLRDAVSRLLARMRASPGTTAAAVAALALVAIILQPGAEPPPLPPATPAATALAPTPDAEAKPEGKPGGTLEFLPAHAPDPAAVLTARRLLPQAWKDCHEASPDKAVAACKLLLDSGIAKGRELDDIQAASGRAHNDRAWASYRAGRLAEALADANTAVRLLAKEAYVWDTRAHINAKLGNREAAIGDFRAALAIDPSYAASRDGLASLGAN